MEQSFSNFSAKYPLASCLWREGTEAVCSHAMQEEKQQSFSQLEDTRNLLCCSLKAKGTLLSVGKPSFITEKHKKFS